MEKPMFIHLFIAPKGMLFCIPLIAAPLASDPNAK
jgi:hypothetical protein